MSHVKIYATNKQTGQRQEVADLYWFRENGVHDFMDAQYFGDEFSFEVEVDGVVHKITSCTEYVP